jgi:nitroreductase
MTHTRASAAWLICIWLLQLSWCSAFAPYAQSTSRKVLPLQQTAAATATAPSEWAATFQDITEQRYACKNFSKRAVATDILERLMRATLRAPTAFNVQPYKALVVTSDEAKQQLSKCMLGPNAHRVLVAGATVVFAADKSCMKNVRKHLALMQETGLPEAFRKKLPLYVSVFSSGHNRVLRALMLAAKRFAFSIARRLGWRLPAVNSAETWAFKVSACCNMHPYLLQACC